MLGFSQVIGIEVVAAVFAAVGAGTGKTPKKEWKDLACDGKELGQIDAFDKACSFFRGQETAASFNSITTIVCAVSAIVMFVSLCISVLLKVAKWPIKIANIVCAVMELIALIVLPVSFNKLLGKDADADFFDIDEVCHTLEMFFHGFCKDVPDAAAFFATTFLAMIANIAAVVCMFVLDP